MALRIAASVRIWRVVISPRRQGRQGPGRAAGHVAPDRLAGGDERRVGHGQAQGLGDDLRGRRRAQELAAAPRAGTGPAAQLRGLLERDLAVRVAGAERLDLAGVLALARRQRHAAGHEHARQVAASRPGPASSPAGPCRRSRCRARPCAGAASGSGAGRRSRRRCDRGGCPSSRACLASGRRTGRRPSPRTGRRPAASAPRPPPGRAGRSPSVRCGIPARSACRRVPAGPPACSGSGTGRGRPRRTSQPIPAFWLRPNRSPEGQSRSIASVSGSAPAGPSAFVFTSPQTSSGESRTDCRLGCCVLDVVVMSSKLSKQEDSTRPYLILVLHGSS